MEEKSKLLGKNDKILAGFRPQDERLLAYFNLIKQHFSLNGNLLEIGCGCVPELALYIDDEQQEIGNGTITVYDPHLIVEELGHITLIRKPFDKTIDISSYDLVIGTRICQANEKVIMSVNKYHKNLFLAFCDCTIKHSERGIMGANVWQPWLVNLSYQTLGPNCDIKLLELDEKLNDRNPIIVIDYGYQRKMLPPR